MVEREGESGRSIKALSKYVEDISYLVRQCNSIV